MARRTAKLVGIVHLQQFGFRMADEGVAHIRRASSRPSASSTAGVIFSGSRDAHVAGLAAVDDVGIGHVDLHDLGIPLFGLLLASRRSGSGVRSTMCSEMYVGQLGAGRGHRLEHVTQFRVQLGALVFECVVFLFQLGEVVFLFVAVRELDRPGFFLYSSRSFLLAGLARCAGRRSRSGR